MLLVNRSMLQMGLAIILALFGSGYSIMAVLFPRTQDIDFVERMALSSCLSLAIGGFLGFALANSIWGLRLIPFLISIALFNIVCYFLVWFRRRNFPDQEMTVNWDSRIFFARLKTSQNSTGSFMTIILVIFFMSGVWVFTQKLHLTPNDPPMTEFFLLGEDLHTENYPLAGSSGDSLVVRYGIVNLEYETGTYQIIASANGEEVGSSQPMEIKPTETQISPIEFFIPNTSEDQVKVEFVLYREDIAYRSLHLWIDCERP